MLRSLLTRLLLPGICGLAFCAFAGVASADQNSATPTTPASQPSTATSTTTSTSPSQAPVSTSPTPVSPTEPTPHPEPSGPTTQSTTEALPQVSAQRPQGRTLGSSTHHTQSKPRGATGPNGANQNAETNGQTKNAHAPSPSTFTPPLPSALGSIGGVPNFFIESFRIPPFLLPIYQAAGTAYGIPWQILAAINEVETNYGRDLSVSSAGAEGWMQFLPSSWAQYGVDATAQGFQDPNNPVDAIFAAARYLKAAGGDKNIRGAIYAYNHSQTYVSSVLLRSQLLGGTPPDLLSAITGLTEARFPVYAASHFSDGFPQAPSASKTPRASKTLVGTTIYSANDAPVVAVADGVVSKIGDSPSLGHYVSLQDPYGNTYTYAELHSVASLYPVLKLRQSFARAKKRVASVASSAQLTPNTPASAGIATSSPIASSLLGAPASEGSQHAVASSTPTDSAALGAAKVFKAGPDTVYLHSLRPGVQVIAGTVLGHIGPSSDDPQPHMLFQIRPAGAQAPLIDPKPILDGWVLLERSSIFRAKGQNPFQGTTPTVGQILLESKQQLQQQVLQDRGVHIYACGRGDIQAGQIDRRVLATLEFLSLSSLKPTVSGLKCGHSGSQSTHNVSQYTYGDALDISAINGVSIAAHHGVGSITNLTIGKLLTLQGTMKPYQITGPNGYPRAKNMIFTPGPSNRIHVSFMPLYSSDAHFAKAVNTVLTPHQWIQLIARLGEIPNPNVSSGPSAAAIADPSSTSNSKVLGGQH